MSQLLEGISRRAARGAYTRLREGETLAAMLGDTSDPSPVLLHLAAVEDSDACACVEEAMRRAAPTFPTARLVTEACAAPPECLPSIKGVPALLAVERGVVLSVCHVALRAAREPEA